MPTGTAGSSQTVRTGWTLFHVVTGPNPPLEDFRSLLAQGQLPRFGVDRPETYRQAAGVSCYETADQARELARRSPFLGSFIAELFIPDDSCAIEVVRTGRSRGHYTVWASPAYFISRVISVQSV